MPTLHDSTATDNELRHDLAQTATEEALDKLAAALAARTRWYRLSDRPHGDVAANALDTVRQIVGA